MKRRILLIGVIVGLYLTGCGSFVRSLQAQTKGGRCAPAMNFTLDDSERPTRLEQMNSELCLKETVRFAFAPAEGRTFPFNGQTLTTVDGVTITQLFQRDPKANFNFSYIIENKTLKIGVDRLSDFNPASDRIKLLPAKISIQFNGNSASFIFTGQETDAELQDKVRDFLAVGRMALPEGFDKASERISRFAKTVWGTFAGGDRYRSPLPLKAAFPVTEMTYNIFALSFALQNQAFEKFRLCENPKTLRQSLLVISGVKVTTSVQAKAEIRKVSFSSNDPSHARPRPQDEGVEVEGGKLCCTLCEIVHCITDNHWADCTCCLFSCKPCPFPF